MSNHKIGAQDGLSADFFRDIIEKQNNPLVRVDAQNRFLYISKAYADYFGIDQHKMIGKVFIPPICEEDIPRFEQTHKQIKETKKSATLIQKELTKHGWIWLEWRITPILGVDGEIEAIQSVGQDVSNLVATRDTLGLIFQALEQASAAVVITDTQASIIYANKKFKDLYGYEDVELIGNSTKMLRSELTDRKIYEEMWGTILRGEAYHCELTNKTKDGKLKWVLLSISPIKSKDGEITHFVAVSEDISFQKRLEEELRGAKRELENINEALEKEVEERTAALQLSNILLKTQIEKRKRIEAEKEQKEKLLAQQSRFASLGEMINMIAHQWRQPLTAISASAINIKTKKELGILTPQTLDEVLDRILLHTQKMSGTINDFLNFFKPLREKEYFKIKTALDETLKLIGAQLRARNIEVAVESDFDISIFGFKNELEQVFINVLSNARDAFENRSVCNKKICVTCDIDDSKVYIRFYDNAGGIEEHLIERVFEPYFTTKEPGKGTGIGLYMSKTILQKSFEGDMRLENIYEEGQRVGAMCQIELNQYKGKSYGS